MVEKIEELWKYPHVQKVDDYDNKRWEMIQKFKSTIFINPIPKLPNISKFKVISLGKYHPILKYFNIFKRMKAAQFQKEKHKNGKMNRYINRMEKYLNNSVGETKFWAIGLLLLSRSTSFRMAQIRQTFPEWYKNQPLEEVISLICEYNQLNLDLFDFKRINIPKPGTDQMRPLGLPKPAWRILQTGMNMLLQIWLKTYQHPNQHGFTPGKGTTTAWDQIYTDVIPSNYIYEFDLDKFFDRVNLDYLSQILKRTGIPDDLVHMLINWSRIFPEEKYDYKQILGKTLRTTIQDSSTDLTWKSEEEKATHLEQHSKLSSSEHNYYDEVRSRTRNWQNNYCFFNGVAQGSPLSPTLSTIMLVPLLFMNNEKVDVIMYADDGLLYSDHPFNPDDILNFPMESGIIAHKEGLKSKWVRRDGKWLSPLKFTGIQYTPHSLLNPKLADPKNRNLSEVLIQGGLISNATKTPRTFIHDKVKAFGLANLFDKWYTLRNKHSTERRYHSQTGQTTIIGGSYGKLAMDELVHNNNYSGYLSSRIYQGSYDNLIIENSWNEYTFVDGSWSYHELNFMKENKFITAHQNLELKEKRRVNLFTASSYATNQLANFISEKGLNRAKFRTSKGVCLYNEEVDEFKSQFNFGSSNLVESQ